MQRGAANINEHDDEHDDKHVPQDEHEQMHLRMNNGVRLREM